MRVITDPFAPDVSYRGDCVLTLGKFDGVHLGHRKLFEILRSVKGEYRKLSVFTFGLSMRSALSGREEKSIYTAEEKRALLENEGVDELIECPFTDHIKNMEPEDFVKEILVDMLGARVIAVGDDFRFGKGRAGDHLLLKKLSYKYGYHCFTVEKLKMNGEEVSSSSIRRLIEEGRVGDAGLLLGRPYFVTGTVEYGAALGRKMGFPTANLKMPPEKLLPPAGVYASVAYTDGDAFPSVSNIGTKPTVSDKGEYLCETHLLDYSGDLYGKRLRVDILKMIRPERRYADISELQSGIAADVSEVRKVFEEPDGERSVLSGNNGVK